jgi:hypothetical protein
MSVRQQVIVGDVEFNPNQTRRLDLPKELPLVGLEMHLNGTLDVTAGPTTNRDEGVLNLINAIRIMADGEAIQTWNGRNLFAYNYFTNEVANGQLQPGTGVALQPFDAYLQLPFGFDPKRITGMPNTTYFDASRLKTFQIEVDWSDQASIISAGTATVVQGATRLQIDAVQLREQPQRLNLPNRLIRTTNLVETSAAANPNFRIRLSRDFDTAFILIRFSDDATGFVLDDSLLVNVGLRLGSNFFIFDQIPRDRWKFWQKRFYRLSEDYPFGTPLAPSQRIEGFIMLSQLQQGQQDLFAPGSVNDFDLLCNVAANTRLDIQQVRIGPPK